MSVTHKMDELKKVEDEIVKKKLQVKKLELEEIELELSKKRNEVNKKRSVHERETRAQHDKDIVNSMDEEDYLRYFAEREAREKRQREERSYRDDDY